MPWSVVCVNDGSSDDTIERLIAAHRREPRIKVIDLSRNFGKEYALTAGLDHAGADVVVLMDSDLQHPPEMVPAMIAKWREGDEVVYMVREMRGDVGLLGRIGRRMSSISSSAWPPTSACRPRPATSACWMPRWSPRSGACPSARGS